MNRGPPSLTDALGAGATLSYLHLSLIRDMAPGTVPPLLLTHARSLTNFTGLVGHRSEQAG